MAKARIWLARSARPAPSIERSKIIPRTVVPRRWVFDQPGIQTEFRLASLPAARATTLQCCAKPAPFIGHAADAGRGFIDVVKLD